MKIVYQASKENLPLLFYTKCYPLMYSSSGNEEYSDDEHEGGILDNLLFATVSDLQYRPPLNM